MFSNFEEFAMSQMLGKPDSPPRHQGQLCFSQDWQRTLFGLTMYLAKQGYFEWEAFRQQLIRAIAEWEDQAPNQAEPGWEYYDQFLTALLRVMSHHQILDEAELRSLLSATAEALPN